MCCEIVDCERGCVCVDVCGEGVDMSAGVCAWT